MIYDEHKKLAQHQAQTKSQMARYEDDLARKRMQARNFIHTFTTFRASFLHSNCPFYRLRMSITEQETKNL